MFTGAIIKETLDDELLLDLLEIKSAEVWKTDDKNMKYWTMIFFESCEPDFPQRLSEVIKDGWFADMKQDGVKYIVFRGCVYQYTIGDADGKNAVCDAMRLRGIPEEQINWSE